MKYKHNNEKPVTPGKDASYKLGAEGFLQLNYGESTPESIIWPALIVPLGRLYTRQTSSTISDKIVETLYLTRVTSENKRIRTPPLSPPFKVGVFVVFYR